ncbi:MAG: hypothetical protein Q9165_003775 [Trypethelium subeluteriae]
MAEGAGLAVGVVALASLFNSTVECFEFVQLGRSFGKDFRTSQLKLDNARLRLSRWGKSLGLDGNIQDAKSLANHLEGGEDIKQAESLLSQIIELFADAEGVSYKYRSRKDIDDTSLQTFNPQTDLEPAMAELHLKMRQISMDRQNRSSLRQMTKWALYEQKHFRRLIEDITELVNNLVDLFPAREEFQRRLCATEVSELGDIEGLSELKEIATAQDRFLADALTRHSERTGGSYNIVFSGDHNSGLQIAHNAGSISNAFNKGA